MNKNLIFHQLFEKESSTYTYLLADSVTREAVLIDPVIETVERDFKLLNELGLNLKFILDTHVHADHITGSGELRKLTGAKTGLSCNYEADCSDLQLKEGDNVKFGTHSIEVLTTPGHTAGCLSYKLNNMIFTGDALLIRGCGRTDFQGGSSENLFQSVREKLFNFEDDTVIFPAHDYKGFTYSTIGHEKRLNPRLNEEISKDQFVQIMKDLKLDLPKKIHEAVPANMHCGLASEDSHIPIISAKMVFEDLQDYKVIDVRRMDEFNNELGHISGAKLATLGPELEQLLTTLPKSDKIVFVCRSGKRSAEATKLALEKGFEHVYNLEGGMLRWNNAQLPTQNS
jgi:sulfur dioxygenase